MRWWWWVVVRGGRFLLLLMLLLVVVSPAETLQPQSATGAALRRGNERTVPCSRA